MQVVWTSLLSGVAGAVVGALAVHFLARSREHEAWIRDRRMEEWRELMSALAGTCAKLVRVATIREYQPPNEDIREWNVAVIEATSALSDRIFIAKDVRKLGLREGFRTASVELRRSRNEQAFTEWFEQARDQIISAAIRR